MVKKLLLLIFLLSSILNASEFEENCLRCHNNNFQFQMFMKRYTLKHSSENRIKKAIFDYLKEPSYSTSLLPFGFLNRFGIKEKTTLDDETLKKMIDIYYKEYNIRSKIY